MLHNTMGVLSDPERGAAVSAAGTVVRRVASWRTRVASLRSEFVSVPLRFVYETNYAMMYVRQG